MQSYRDLPLLYNQWANVVRWELRPRLFLRTTEFLWQEGHTAHETEEEAIAETLTILHDVYADTIENVLAIPVLRGRKSESERFPGAVDTYTLEALMRDGKALQAATSHYLGQGFARAFGVRYTGRDGSEQLPVRDLVGREHAAGRRRRDGARRRPRAAAPAPRRAAAGRDRADLPRRTSAPRCSRPPRPSPPSCARRAFASASTTAPEHRPGFKFNEWELKGVPLRIEIGRRDLAAAAVTVARRDTGEKQQIPLPASPAAIDELLARRPDVALRDRPRRTGAADAARPEQLRRADRVPPRSRRVRRSAVVRPQRVRGAASRTTAPRRSAACRSDEQPTRPGACVCCGRPAAAAAVWAQAY